LWAKQLSQLLIGLHHQKKKGHQFTKTKYEKILKQNEQLIAPTINHYNNIYTKTKEEQLVFALEKHKHLFLKFIAIPLVSFDNNQAERDLRMIKEKQT